MPAFYSYSFSLQNSFFLLSCNEFISIYKGKHFARKSYSRWNCSSACSILNSVLPWMHFRGFSLFLKEFNCVQIPGTWANFQMLHPTPTVLALRNGLPSYKFLIKSRTFWTHRNGPAFQTYTYPNYQNVHTLENCNSVPRRLYFPALQ